MNTRSLTSARASRLLGRTILAAFFSIAVAGSVRAADIPRLAGPVTDQAGVVNDESAIEAAIESLLADQNVQLFVVFVATTDELSAPDFAAETATSNSLGANDALLLVATDDRTDAIWVADGLDEITDDEIDTIIADVLEPRLRDGDFDGAAIATAEALGTAAETASPTEAPPTGAGGPVTTPAPGAGGTTDGDGFGLAGVLLLLGGVGILLVVGGRWLSGVLVGRREAEERDRRTGKLAREANALLVQTDERIRTAGQEVGYVEASYGVEETAPLRKAVGDAQAELRAAFEIRQRLDDAEPEDPPTREAMLTEIVERTRGAQAALDREAARIAELRDLERDAPAVLDELGPRIAAIEARLPAAESAMAELTTSAPAAVAPVRGNVTEARKGIDGARAAVDAARQALSRNDRRAAAKGARTAIVGVDGAVALVDAIEKQVAAIREAETRLPQELAAAEAGLAEARAAMERATDQGQLDAADEAVRSARAAAGAGDPLAALRAATEAHRSAEAAVAQIRHAALEQSRLLATADASLVTAHADIDRAADFIATRRTGVGRAARTRLAEAERHFEAAAALRDTDPQGSIANARRAEQLAEQAYSLADRDFTNWDGGGHGGTGVPGRSSGSEVLGGILGGNPRRNPVGRWSGRWLGRVAMGLSGTVRRRRRLGRRWRWKRSVRRGRRIRRRRGRRRRTVAWWKMVTVDTYPGSSCSLPFLRET